MLTFALLRCRVWTRLVKCWHPDLGRDPSCRRATPPAKCKPFLETARRPEWKVALSSTSTSISLAGNPRSKDFARAKQANQCKALRTANPILCHHRHISAIWLHFAANAVNRAIVASKTCALRYGTGKQSSNTRYFVLLPGGFSVKLAANLRGNILPVRSTSP